MFQFHEVHCKAQHGTSTVDAPCWRDVLNRPLTFQDLTLECIKGGRAGSVSVNLFFNHKASQYACLLPLSPHLIAHRLTDRLVSKTTTDRTSLQSLTTTVSMSASLSRDTLTDAQGKLGISIDSREDGGNIKYFISVHGLHPNVVRAYPFETCLEMVDQLSSIVQAYKKSHKADSYDEVGHASVTETHIDCDRKDPLNASVTRASSVKAGKHSATFGDPINLAQSDANSDEGVESEVWSTEAQALRDSEASVKTEKGKGKAGYDSVPPNRRAEDPSFSWTNLNLSDVTRTALKKWFNEDHSVLRETFQPGISNAERFDRLNSDVSHRNVFEMMFADLMTFPKHRAAYAVFESIFAPASEPQQPPESQAGPSCSA